MTAALYAVCAGKRVLLLEDGFYGGQIIQSNKVENYPGAPEINGVDLAERMMAQLAEQGLGTTYGKVEALARHENGFTLTTDAGAYTAGAVILATGVGHRKLEVPGEEALIGRGVSFCATCDGMLFRGREVAVVGGGNTAVQDALVLAELCSQVYLIHRREGFRAEQRLMDRLGRAQNVTVLTNTVVTAMQGDARLESLTLQNVVSGEERQLPVAGVFEAVGNLARNAAFAEWITLDEGGYIVTDEDCATSCQGIFAAGDCRQKKVRQLTTAVSDGTVAALAAVEYLG
jgi:thioredoxin reductase (NADPH)